MEESERGNMNCQIEAANERELQSKLYVMFDKIWELQFLRLN